MWKRSEYLNGLREILFDATLVGFEIESPDLIDFAGGHLCRFLEELFRVLASGR